MLLDKSKMHTRAASYMRIGIICVFKENANKTQTIFCRTYTAVFCHFCRTNLAFSDISCVFWSFLSDTSSFGHIWICRTYLAGTRPTTKDTNTNSLCVGKYSSSKPLCGCLCVRQRCTGNAGINTVANVCF